MKAKKINKYKLTISLFLIIIVSFIVIQSLVTFITQNVLEITIIKQLKNANPNIHTIFKVFSFVAVGIGVSFFISTFILKPVHVIIEGIHRIGEGDFTIRLEETGVKDLKSLAISINKMAKELENKEIFNTDFINNFSHEFKTPIVSIKGFAEILKENNLSDDERKEYLNIIINQSDRLSKLATNVLDLSKFESEEILKDLETFNLTEQITQSILLFEKQLDDKNIDLNVDMETIYFTANKEHLSHIWINLIDNGIKFSPVNGIIIISLYQVHSSIVFTICNKNSYIKKEDIPYIFDKFYKSKNSSKGNGLGLSVAKKVAMIYGGNITCNSNEEKGTEFKVII
ncbi:sensor histidine kinase [Vallitalea okinawensis]|uniref:sensor histidine kinase n=1 Tax=Vallitalea okinawensis TaxID=2078660 RepID=UPI000CFBE24B|nr:HAMP domain-containing sensor histidine kinase [Vallitalea okinawensis]